MITAKWERGFESFYKGIDANEVAQEIISIGDDATPQQIVDKARDFAPQSALSSGIQLLSCRCQPVSWLRR